jgi:hypothetical protein
MKYYQMGKKTGPDGTIIFQQSHEFFRLKTGHKLKPDFKGPFIVELDDEHPDGRLPTFYESPAFIGTKEFYNALINVGVSNIETVEVIIKDTVRSIECHDYLLLNIVGRVACADMMRSEHRSLGPDMTIIDQLVLKPVNLSGLDLFVADEDTDIMIVSERVCRHLISCGYVDIWFEELSRAE